MVEVGLTEGSNEGMGGDRPDSCRSDITVIEERGGEERNEAKRKRQRNGRGDTRRGETRRGTAGTLAPAEADENGGSTKRKGEMDSWSAKMVG